MTLTAELQDWAARSPFGFGLFGGSLLAAAILGWHLVARFME
jgi:hypothetical protein